MKITDTLSLDDAATLLAGRDMRRGDTLRTAKDRNRKRILYAVQKNRLARNPNDSFRVGALVAWAFRIWPTRFADLPRDPNIFAMEVSEGAHAGEAMVDIHLPGNVEACHKLITAMAHNEKRLMEFARHLIAERDALEPDAIAWRQLCRRNTASARKPRGVEKLS